MVYTEEIIEEAESNGIEIFYGNLPLSEAVSVPGYIGLDYSLMTSPAKEKIACTHELGHNVTGGFYTRNSSPLEKRRAEVRADRYTYRKLLPLEDLQDAVRKGYREPWEIADYLELTNEFVADALKYYTEHGYILTDADAC